MEARLVFVCHARRTLRHFLANRQWRHWLAADKKEEDNYSPTPKALNYQQTRILVLPHPKRGVYQLDNWIRRV